MDSKFWNPARLLKCVKNIRYGAIFRFSRLLADGRVVKLFTAYGGCSGNQRRGKTWRATIRIGEPQAGHDPMISEWGNPLWVMP